ncbi:MAG: GntR family transcriptional regulator [Myxococcota bacterium]|nr:GntR family transcriptional regulator [Myxococcota bacterium]
MSGRAGTVVEEIVSAICVAIFRGEHKVGEKLPPLRTLAKTYDVTLPTMQRVIARMEELGLIEVRQGSGVTVLEPLSHAHPSAIPYWLEALRDEPAEASRYLGDFLELRNDLGLATLLKIRPLLQSSEGERVAAALEEFARSAATMTPEEAFEADFELMRRLIALKPQVAYSTMLNVLASIVRGLPQLVEMIYDQPERNAKGYQAVLALARDKKVTDTELRDQVASVLKAFDMITVSKFRALLELGLEQEGA